VSPWVASLYNPCSWTNPVKSRKTEERTNLSQRAMCNGLHIVDAAGSRLKRQRGDAYFWRRTAKTEPGIPRL